jgi:hypothetical protein
MMMAASTVRRYDRGVIRMHLAHRVVRVVARPQAGQALVLVAAMLAVVFGLALLGLDVAAQRRTVRMVQAVTDTAAMAAVHDLDLRALERGAPQIRASVAVPRARAVLAQRLTAVRGMVKPAPEELAAAADIWVVGADQPCARGARTEVGGVICISLRYAIRSSIGGERWYGATAEATWTARP